MYKTHKVIYCLGGADIKYKALGFFIFYGEEPTIEEIKMKAYEMADRNPSIKEVYVVDNRYGLKHDFIKSCKGDSIESCYVFKDLVARSGIMIPV